jgi:hypothetical protein
MLNFLPWLLDGSSRPEYSHKILQADSADIIVIQDLDITLM